MNFDVYGQWNFKNNPFTIKALSSDEIGNDLFAGREEEIKKFLRRLYNAPQIVTVEGDAGIGKTSLVNVGVFRATLKHYNDRKSPLVKDNPLFVSCNKSFQLSQDIHYMNFIEEVMAGIAQTIILHKDHFHKLGIKLPKNLDEVDKWMNSPSNSSYHGTIGIPFAQIGYGKTYETNTASGFEKSGLQEIVTNWLKQMFPENNAGGIVCIIDNLELLEKSVTARKVIENLRDTLLNIQGIRWVFCGSLGIVTSILSSPRLEGVLHEPIEVTGISRTLLKDVLQKRIDKYKQNDEYYLPITVGSFTLLYDILKNNLRNALKFANDYCLWTADTDQKPIMKDEKEDLFIDWVIEKSKKYKTEIEKQIKPASYKLFTDVLQLGDSFAFSDFEICGFKNQQSYKNCIQELETVGLVVSVMDENDNRRKSIQITPKGWFVSHAISTQV